MGNRERIDRGIEEQVRGYVRDLLTAHGQVSCDQRRLLAEMINRSERTVARYVTEEAVSLGINLRQGNRPEVRENEGLDGLLTRGSFSFADPELKRLTLAYAGNLRALHRDASRVAKQLELAGPISYQHLVRKFNEEVPSDQRNLIRNGIYGFKSSSVYVRWSAPYRNSVWQIDATEMDLWIRPKGTSQRIRPWVLVIIDDYSRVILSASLMLHDYTAEDSAACIHRAMRLRTVTLPDGRQIEVGGLPEKVLCDNALQFTGQVLSHVALMLNFTMWAVAAYAGEKKGKVERAIRSVNEGFARTLPGYANRNLKSASMRDALHAVDTQLLDEQQVLNALGTWVEEWNNSPHPDQPGKSRYEVWADDTHGLQAVDEELLRPATVSMPRPKYRYHRDGFRVQRDKAKRFYVDTSLQLQVRSYYLLRHLPGVTDWVDAYTLDGRFVARCWDGTLLDQETRLHVERHRQETYRTMRTLRSEAVELRALAASAVADVDELPNPIAVAHQQAVTGGTPDLVKASLPGGVTDQPSLRSGDATDEPSALTVGDADTDHEADGVDVQEDSTDRGGALDLDDLARSAVAGILADDDEDDVA